MSEVFSVLKTLVITVVVIVAMQIEVDGMTLEKKSHLFLTQSAFAGHIHSVAKGAIKASKEGYVWTKDFVENQYASFKARSK